MTNRIYPITAVIGITVIGCSVYVTDRVSNIERRLRFAEVALKEHTRLLANTGTASRVGVSEKIPPVSEFNELAAANGMGSLEQRVRNIENKIEPHLEVLPPYIPTDK